MRKIRIVRMVRMVGMARRMVRMVRRMIRMDIQDDGREISSFSEVMTIVWRYVIGHLHSPWCHRRGGSRRR